MKKIKNLTILAVAALVFTINCACVFAATPVPAKSSGNASTSDTPSSTTAVATSKPTAKATTKPTAKATTKPSTKATTKPTEEPAEEIDLEVDTQPSEAVTKNNDPLVFTQEADEGVLGVDAQNARVASNKYTTKGGSFGWFVLSVIVNAIISFIIGNRFYKMSRKDKHILAEVRALKRDIDAKMQGQIGGFSEYETVIENSNKDLGDGEKIEVTKSEEDIKAEEMANEIYRKWESQIAAAKQREAQSMRRTSVSKSRTSRANAKKKDSNGLSGKVKGFINDVFPFDKD